MRIAEYVYNIIAFDFLFRSGFDERALSVKTIAMIFCRPSSPRARRMTLFDFLENCVIFAPAR